MSLNRNLECGKFHLTRRKFAGVAAGLLAPFGLSGQQPPATSSPASWMSKIPDSKLLSELTIPGTHDSGTRSTTSGKMFGWTTQTMSIRQQLESGIRFLDIRCRRYNGTLQVYHGMVAQDLDFRNGIGDVCRQFLTEHPSECILMSLKEEGDPVGANKSFQEMFLSDVESWKDRWRLQGDIPKLGEARGKVVLFRRFTGSLGVNCTAWADNATFNLTVPGTVSKIHVQDVYDVSTRFSIPGKWNNVQTCLEDSLRGNSSVLYLNYTSGAGKPMVNNPADVAKGSITDNGINRLLYNYLKQRDPGRYGVIIMDFPEFPSPSGVMQRLLISLNGVTLDDVWSFPRMISGADAPLTRAAPALAYLKGRLHMAYLDNNSSSSRIWVCSSGDGRNWSKSVNVSAQHSALTRAAPALTVFRDKLWMAFLDNNPSSSNIWVCSSDDGVRWSECTKLINDAFTRTTPALAVLNGRLHLAFLDNNRSSSDIWICRSDDGVTWSSCTSISKINRALTRTAPALASLGNKLCLAFLDNNSSRSDIWTCTSEDGVNWSKECYNVSTQNRALTKAAPSLAVAAGRFYLTFVDNNPNETMIYTCTSRDGAKWDSVTNISQQNQALTRATPAVAPMGDSICLTFLDDNPNRFNLWACSMRPLRT